MHQNQIIWTMIGKLLRFLLLVQTHCKRVKLKQQIQTLKYTFRPLKVVSASGIKCFLARPAFLNLSPNMLPASLKSYIHRLHRNFPQIYWYSTPPHPPSHHHHHHHHDQSRRLGKSVCKDEWAPDKWRMSQAESSLHWTAITGWPYLYLECLQVDLNFFRRKSIRT